jgi:hypothetical protein
MAVLRVYTLVPSIVARSLYAAKRILGDTLGARNLLPLSAPVGTRHRGRHG